MVWKYGDTYLKEGQSWIADDGTMHPAQWMRWTDSEKSSKGLSWEADKKSYDSYYYYGWNSDESALLPKPMAELQLLKVTDAKELSGSLLAETDWYVVRKTETSTAIPSGITAYRTAVRANYAVLKSAINNASDIDELKAVYETTAGASISPKTIDATSSSVVSTSNNTITSNGHGFVNDEQVMYSVGLNSSNNNATIILELVNSTSYYIISTVTNTFKFL